MPKVESLRFYRMPKPIARDAYDEAMARYARAVAPRASAVYRVGNIDFPGLSDLDLLVVPSVARADNPQFFSVLDRLPKRLHNVFRHQPTILPPDQLDIIRHTSHRTRQLLMGDDVIANIHPLTTPAEYWCKLLEGYCNQERYLQTCAVSSRVAAGQAIAMCVSLRYPLQWLDAVSASDDATAYRRAIDELRAQFFSDPQRDRELLFSMWGMHLEAMQRFLAKLRTLLPLRHQETVLDFSRRVLTGDAVCPLFDTGEVRARRTRIDQYLAEVDRMMFSYGYLFVNVIYSTNGSRYRQTRISRRWWSLYYRTTRWRSTSNK